MKQRDIILLPFPFSDQSGVKVRPALILSNNNFNNSSDDLIVCAITTMIKPSKYSIVIGQDDIEAGVLYEKSSIKVETILKIDKTIVIKKIAAINKRTFSKVNSIINDIFKE